MTKYKNVPKLSVLPLLIWTGELIEREREREREGRERERVGLIIVWAPLFVEIYIVLTMAIAACANVFKLTENKTKQNKKKGGGGQNLGYPRKATRSIA